MGGKIGTMASDFNKNSIYLKLSGFLDDCQLPNSGLVSDGGL
jgi:hypothetical protein